MNKSTKVKGRTEESQLPSMLIVWLRMVSLSLVTSRGLISEMLNFLGLSVMLNLIPSISLVESGEWDGLNITPLSTNIEVRIVLSQN